MKILILYIISNHSLLYIIQTEGPGVARGNKNAISFYPLTLPAPMSVQKKFQPFGPAVWPAIGNID